jgi:Tat protein translocase TatB subunit
VFGIGMTELLVIFVVGLLVLGPKRLPEVARSLGRSLAEFRRASNDLRREFMDVAEEAKVTPPPLPPEASPAAAHRPPGAATEAPGEPGAAARAAGESSAAGSIAAAGAPGASKDPESAEASPGASTGAPPHETDARRDG